MKTKDNSNIFELIIILIFFGCIGCNKTLEQNIEILVFSDESTTIEKPLYIIYKHIKIKPLDGNIKYQEILEYNDSILSNGKIEIDMSSSEWIFFLDSANNVDSATFKDLGLNKVFFHTYSLLSEDSIIINGINTSILIFYNSNPPTDGQEKIIYHKKFGVFFHYYPDWTLYFAQKPNSFCDYNIYSALEVIKKYSHQD
ncbi:MAG: hypothetical protein WAT52_10425 [Chitinophagales bacterium]